MEGVGRDWRALQLYRVGKGRAWGETTVNHHVPQLCHEAQNKTGSDVQGGILEDELSLVELERRALHRDAVQSGQSLQQQNGHEVNVCLVYNLGKF